MTTMTLPQIDVVVFLFLFVVLFSIEGAQKRLSKSGYARPFTQEYRFGKGFRCASLAPPPCYKSFSLALILRRLLKHCPVVSV